jgi:hypothetical protein
VATIKRQLQRLLPRIQVFLDVDDLEDIASLERHVSASAAVLIYLGSTRYFASPNCLRELEAASASARPLVCVWDEAKAPPLEALRGACPEGHRARVFDGDVVDWCRVKDFQLVALAQIAEQVLLACGTGAASGLCVQGALAWAPLRFERPVLVYASPHNPDAAPVLARLCEQHAPLRAADTARAADQWLVCLSASCFEGERGAALAVELAEALRARVPLTLVYAPEGGPFGGIMQATPRALLELRLYDTLALEWRRGPLRRASEQLVVHRLGARADDGRRCWCAPVDISWCASIAPPWVRSQNAPLLETADGAMQQPSRRGMAAGLRASSKASSRSRKEVVAVGNAVTSAHETHEQL